MKKMRNQNIVPRDQDRSTSTRFAKGQSLPLSTHKALPTSQTTSRIRHRFVDNRVSPGAMKSRASLRMFVNEFADLEDRDERDFSQQWQENEHLDNNQGVCAGSLPTAETSRIRILSVNENPLLLKGIRAVLADHPDMLLVAWAGSVEDGIRKYVEHQPDVMLMDYTLPAVNGFDAIGAIRDELPDARLIIHTTKWGDVQASRALRAGALGYIPERTLCRDLLDAIRTVHRGQRYIPPEVADALAQHAADDPLTPREIEILGHLTTGSANKMIAYQLGISEGTVKSHMRSILSKLSANDRAHAVVIGIRRGFIEL
jgi:DNA-binding NarL/FixJ family response regulator